MFLGCFVEIWGFVIGFGVLFSGYFFDSCKELVGEVGIGNFVCCGVFCLV